MENRPALPPEWSWVTIGDIADTTSGGTPSRSRKNFYGGETPWVKSGELRDGIINVVEETITEDGLKNSSAKIFPRDTVLVALYGATVGKTAILGIDAATNQAVCAIFPRSNSFIPKYMHYWIRSQRENLIGLSAGGTQPNINQGIIRSYPFPLAPLPEQQRIVAKIEELFTQLDAAEAALKRAKVNLKRYRQSVLQAAVIGELTRAWREAHRGQVEPASELLEHILIERQFLWETDLRNKDRDVIISEYKNPRPPNHDSLQNLPDGWYWATTDQLFYFVTSGSRGWAKYYSDTGATFIRIGNLDHETIELDLKNIQRVSPPSMTEGIRTRVSENDILISITADVGMVGIVPNNIGEAYINQHISLARPVKSIIPKYLAWFLTSENGQSQFKRLQRGATKMGLGLEDIKNVNIPIPPIEEQEFIVEELEKYLSLVDEIEEAIRMAFHRIKYLRQSILQRAFNGQLLQHEAETIDIPFDNHLSNQPCQPSLF